MRRLALAKRLAGRLTAYMESLPDMTKPVKELRSAQELATRFANLGCDLSLRGEQAPMDDDALERAFDEALASSVRTGHPLFMNQLFAGGDPISVVGDWLLSATNTNAHTYEVAPVFTLVENAVIEKCADLAGWSSDSDADGLFTPGGSISNLYGMHLARAAADPELAERGAIGGRRMVAFVSENAHYSFKKTALVLGLGLNNLVQVPSLASSGQMDTEALAEAIRAVENDGTNALPFFVGSTSGTTVRGAYDNLKAISTICEQSPSPLWHHCDASWGGGVLWSRTHSGLMSGIEQCDSFATNPHKMLGSVLSSAIFMTRHKNALQAANATHAAYLFQPDKLNGDLDIGDKTIMCGRRGDAYKLWLMWKAAGDAGLEARIDRCFDLAEAAKNHVRERERTDGALRIAVDSSCTNVCFFVVPSSLRHLDTASLETLEKSSTPGMDDVDRLHRIAPRVKKMMESNGDAMVGFQAVDGLPNFFRLVVASTSSQLADEELTAMLDRMVTIAEDVQE